MAGVFFGGVILRYGRGDFKVQSLVYPVYRKKPEKLGFGHFCPLRSNAISETRFMGFLPKTKLFLVFE